MDPTHITVAYLAAAQGNALYYASKTLDGLTPSNNDQKVGLDIVRPALPESRGRKRKRWKRRQPQDGKQNQPYVGFLGSRPALLAARCARITPTVSRPLTAATPVRIR